MRPAPVEVFCTKNCGYKKHFFGLLWQRGPGTFLDTPDAQGPQKDKEILVWGFLQKKKKKKKVFLFFMSTSQTVS